MENKEFYKKLDWEEALEQPFERELLSNKLPLRGDLFDDIF